MPTTFFGALLCLAFVGAVFLATNRIPPAWDALHYLDMSRYGVTGNENLSAPFAYRIGVPLVAGAVSDLFQIPIELTYRAGAILAASLFILITLSISLKICRDIRFATLTALLTAAGFWHVKFSAFFDTAIDIYALFLLVLAWFFILKKWWIPAFLIGIFGLLVKEWLGVIIALLTFLSLRWAVQERRISNFAVPLGIILAGGAVIWLPRALIEVAQTVQMFDPLNDPDWQSVLLSVWTNKARVFNLCLSSLSYWMPLLLLLTPGRMQGILVDLKRDGLLAICILHIGLVSLLALYGGTNIPIFVSYSAPVLAVTLSYLMSRSVPLVEIVVAFGVVLLINRIFVNVPDPRIDMGMYLDHIPGYDSRLNGRSFTRLIELVTAIVVFRLAVWGSMKYSLSKAPDV